MVEKLKLPLSIVEHQESYEIQDASGIRACFIYFDNDPDIRRETRRMTQAQALAFARQIIRLPELLEKERPPA